MILNLLFSLTFISLNRFVNYFFLFINAVLLFSACKKDYITGGNAEDVNIYKNISTYDYLASNPLYDTLIQVIDAAGFKDKFNEANTALFIPSDYSVYNYLSQRTAVVQETISQDSFFGLDSLLYYMKNNVNNTRDSLLMYMIAQPLLYSSLTDAGAFYQTELPGDSVVVSYEYTRNDQLGYNGTVSTVPQVVYFTQIWYPYELSSKNTAGDIPESVGVRTLVKTSGLQTRTGIVNALDNSHTLFFYGTKQ